MATFKNVSFTNIVIKRVSNGISFSNNLSQNAEWYFKTNLQEIT